MSEETEKRMTAADIKKQIDEATKASKAKVEIKDSGLPLTGQLANEINATESTPKVTEKAESKPEPVKAAEIASDKSDGLQEWAKKKGIDWTTDDSVLSALRKSDQEFHKKRQQEKEKERQPNGYGNGYQYPNVPPPPPAPVYPNYGYPQPAYAPFQGDRRVVENLARQYNMLPEDFERFAALNRDLVDAMLTQERQRQSKEIETLRVENQKNSVFRELSADPVFRRPDVGLEFHKVLEEMQEQEPKLFEEDPTAYKRVYDKALVNIARRNLEGRPLQEGVSPTPVQVQIPSTPPRQLGQGSGGGALENENGIDPKQFAKLTLADQKALLDKMGLRPAY